MDGGRAKSAVGIVDGAMNFVLWGCLKFAPSPLPLPPGEVPPEGRGRGIVQTVRAGMQFMRGIGTVVIWVVCRWNQCGKPSQALCASSPRGRAKGLVDIVDRSINFGL